ncbi:hypothetical protein NM208_g2693 [Fusarium decemcellulare]|uniref:Uncharacterized protein n=2 Tax=Fusarium decemcellulare TaxID=57161 RepID=A0ACC1SRV0_9HYPO|nr:hypothetical protein NM208_g4976 [Fusarium decemcellulare]KAJ3545082.1 hypothetical protein NM208_g2693 [Fusarium decemcellulare]
MKALPSELEIRWMKEYPDAPFIRYLSLLNREVLMVNNAHAQKAVLQTKCYSFVKPPFWERIIGEIAGKGLAALGYELNSLSTSSELATHYARIFEFVTPLQVAISFVNQFVPIRSVLPFEANRSYVDANAQVRRILREHIRQRRGEYRQGKIKGEKASRDLLTLMIEESQDAWSEEEMLGYLLNFMSAGHETTAGALTWALYVLTLQPDIQKRVREEVQTNITSLFPTQSEIENLPYMNNFLSEVLRFYPPAPNFYRQAVEDVEIEGVKIPKGTLVMIAPAAPHFNPLIWGSTADEFNPDRWDSLPSPARDPHVSLAFSSGPRVCIGKQFALLEMKVIMAELIRNFEFENTGHVEAQKSGPSLRPINGMRLNISAVKRG